MDQSAPESSGSFMAPAGGGGNAIAQAMSRRGLGGAALNQIGPAAPTFASSAQQPGTPPPAAPPAPGLGAATMAGPQGVGTGTPESNIILRAMADRLKHDSKVRESQIGGV